MTTTAHQVILWPLLLYFILVVIVVAAMLLFTYYLGERRRDHTKAIPYESGMLPTGSARIRFPSEFYLIAMFFVLFDLETVFIVAWAICMRNVGWRGFATIAIFIAVLFIALAYLWREGALDWGTSRYNSMNSSAREGSRQYEDSSK